MPTPTPTNDTEQTLLQRFIAAYVFASAHPEQGPDPSLEELRDTEDQLSTIVAALEPTELTQEQREELRGSRGMDLPDLMGETAEALRLCPDVAVSLKAPPELLKRVAAQEAAVNALIGTLDILHNCVDTGMLLRAGEAEELLDAVDAEVARLTDLNGELSQEQRIVVQGTFDIPQSQCQVMRNRAVDRAAVNESATAEAQGALSASEQREEIAGLVRSLVEKALKGTPAASAVSR